MSRGRERPNRDPVGRAFPALVSLIVARNKPLSAVTGYRIVFLYGQTCHVLGSVPQ